MPEIRLFAEVDVNRLTTGLIMGLAACGGPATVGDRCDPGEGLPGVACTAEGTFVTCVDETWQETDQENCWCDSENEVACVID
jgi:hypothetical protein